MADKSDVDSEVDALITQEVEELVKTLEEAKDPILLLLRCHLLSENLLDRIILAKLTRGDRIIDKGDLTFHQKLCLVDSFNILPDPSIQALKQLNSIRNKCSHEKGRQLTTADIELIGRPFGHTFTQLRRQHKTDVGILFTLTFSEIYKPMLIKVVSLEIIGT